MRKILLISTGGTIEKTYCEDEGSLHNTESVILEKIVQKLRLPYMSLGIHVLLRKDSLQLTDYDRELISKKLQECESFYDGIVVLHGTDTMDLTTEYCSQSFQPKIPILFTGAMRPIEFENSDAIQNVTEALYASQIAKPGIYVSFHNRLFPCPGVRKNRKKLTFESIDD